MIFLPLVGSQMENRRRQVVSPFMSDALTGAIFLRPARVLGCGALQPLLQLVSRHIDCLVEVPADISDCKWTWEPTALYLMTSSSLLTILKAPWVEILALECTMSQSIPYFPNDIYTHKRTSGGTTF